MFGAFRNGFKSGGFQTGSGLVPVPGGLDLTYRPENVRGGEVGVKARLGRVRLNLTGYRYNYDNLQESTLDPIRIQQRVINAASSLIQGIEFDGAYRAPIDGLELRGAVNYNHARYVTFLSGCYTGQTIAAGCDINPNPVTGAFRQQDMGGRQLLFAPDWSGKAGFTYARPVGVGRRLELTGDATFSSAYWAQLEEAPLGRQRAYCRFDASLRYGAESGAWDVALIGRNLSEVYRSNWVSQATLTGISARTGTNLAGGLTDITGVSNRGREIRLQLTTRFR